MDGVTTTYEYDRMNRLSKENDTVYSFDDFGNRHTMTDGSSTTAYTYDLNNRLTKSVESSEDTVKTTMFFYDKNGNQISKAVMTNHPYIDGTKSDYSISQISNENVALYDYNCYNQLVGVETNGVVASYTYAPDGLRYSKTVDGDTITFVYDSSNVVEEITANDTNKYYRGYGIIKNSDGNYYIYNGQGDVVLLTNSTGTKIAGYTFDAFGNQSEKNAVYNPFGYRGEYTDGESGLIFLRARMYDSATGRFINEDPVKDGLNWYVYCSNDPINFVDPWGMFDYDTIYMQGSPYNIEIEILQNELKWLGYYSGDIDGLYGDLTKQAVIAFQSDCGLSVDGIVGVNTWSSLGLKYRTQNDIANGVQVLTIGRRQWLTSEFEGHRILPYQTLEERLSNDPLMKHLLEDSMDIAINSSFMAGGVKFDLKMVDQAAKQLGMSMTQRQMFKQEIEFLKGSVGKPGNVNFSWNELLEIGKEIMEWFK